MFAFSPPVHSSCATFLPACSARRGDRLRLEHVGRVGARARAVAVEGERVDLSNGLPGVEEGVVGAAVHARVGAGGEGVPALARVRREALGQAVVAGGAVLHQVGVGGHQPGPGVALHQVGTHAVGAEQHDRMRGGSGLGGRGSDRCSGRAHPDQAGGEAEDKGEHERQSTQHGGSPGFGHSGHRRASTERLGGVNAASVKSARRPEKQLLHLAPHALINRPGTPHKGHDRLLISDSTLIDYPARQARAGPARR